jgi:predicted nucleic acid-binding protein
VIVLDASVLIAHLDEHDALHARAEEALERAASEPLGCSSITLAEVLVGPACHGQLSAAQTAVAELEVEEIPLGPDAAVRLATMRAEIGLKLPDCCVLLAAQETSAQAIVSFDDALARAAERSGFETF